MLKYIPTSTGAIIWFVLLFAYLAGIAIAKGFWMTIGALFPLYSWYLVVEKIMIAQGWA